MALDNDGDVEYVQGSGAKPYELKNVGGVLSCSCPAWRNQGVPIDRRTCKHLKQLRGAAAEAARTGAPQAPVFRTAGTETGRIQTSKPNAVLAPSAASVPDGKRLFGCACEGGSCCDVSHDPDLCACAMCSGAGVTREEREAMMEKALGRKLRQDEKAKLHGPPVLLAHSFEDHDDLDPTGWWYSEKLDGVRAYWNGKDFISRQGNVFHAPDWFKAPLPKGCALDGELWMGRRMFQKTISVVKRQDWGDGAQLVKYVVFDVPDHGGIFEARINAAINHAMAAGVPHFVAHPHDLVRSRKHLLDELRRVEALGGEGLMIRKPKSAYEIGRSSTLLKVKPFKDAEAVVIGHVPGKGKHRGVLGGLAVRMPDGRTFNVGSGLTDAERRSPPPVGATITYRYTELTDGGIPKCASYVCMRDYE